MNQSGKRNTGMALSHTA